MKVWLALLSLFLGWQFCTANHVLQVGKTISYDYDVIVANGIDNDSELKAAFRLKSSVEVHTVSPNRLLIQMRHIEIGKVNKAISEVVPDEVPVTSVENKRGYESFNELFSVEYNSEGIIETVSFNSEVPTSVQDVQIALASVFQLPNARAGSQHPNRRYVRETDDDKENFVVELMEPSLSGVCNSIISFETVEKGTRETSDLKITKIRDFEDCEEKPYFVTSTHRSFQCDQCEKDISKPITNNFVCEYDIRTVHSDDKYVIENVTCEGLIRFAPVGHDADAFTIVHKQNLSLQGYDSISRESHGEPSNLEPRKPYSDLLERVEIMRNPKDLETPIAFQQMFDTEHSFKNEVRDVILNAAKRLESLPSTDELKVFVHQIPHIVKGLVTLSFSEIRELITEFSSSEIERKLLWDCIAIAATNPCFKAMLISFENNVLSAEELASLLPISAGHVINPNTKLVDRLLEFLHSEKVKQDEALYTSTVLSFGTIVAKTCAQGPYDMPEGLEPQCSEEKINSYIRGLQKELKEVRHEPQKMALLMSLGNMAVKEAIFALSDYIYKNSNVSEVLQIKAIYAMIPIAKVFPEEVRGPLMGVLFSSGETTKARIAAFSVILISRPSRHLYEKIAVLTHHESDFTLNTFIYSYFDALANSSNPCLADAASHAEHAISLMDDEYDTSALLGSTSIIEGFVDPLEVGAFGRLSTVGDAGSMIPTNLILLMEKDISSYATVFLKLGMMGNNISHLIDRVIGPTALFSRKSLLERIKELDAEVEDMGNEDIAGQVDYLPRDIPNFSTYIFTRFMDFQQRQFHVNREKLIKFLEQRGDMGSRPLKFNYNIQKSLMPLAMFYRFPMETGFNADLRAKIPMHVSLDFQVAISPEKSDAKSIDFKFEVDAHINLATSVHVQASVLLPVELTSITSGYDTTVVASPIVSVDLALQLQDEHLRVKIVESQRPTAPDSEILYFHTRPYTAVERPFAMKHYMEFAEIAHVRKPTQYTIPLFGNAVIVKVSQEDFWNDRASLYQFIDNPLYGTFNFWWMTNQWNKREISIIMRKPITEVDYSVSWKYEAAESDPEKRYTNFWYLLWKDLFGWADIPINCRHADESESRNSDEDYTDEAEWGIHSSVHKSDRHLKPYGLSDSSDSEESDEDTRRKETTYSYKKKYQSDAFSSKFGKSLERDDDNDDDDDSREDSWSTSPRSQHKSFSSHSSSFNKRKDDRDYEDYEENRKYSSKSTSKHMMRNEDFERFKIERSEIGKGVAVYKIKSALTIKGTDGEKKSEVDLILKKHRSSNSKTLNVTYTSHTNSGPKTICLNSHFRSSRSPCYFGSRIPDLRKAMMSSSTEIKWGQSCDRPEGSFDIRVKAKKSHEQLRERSKPWFFTQCKEDFSDEMPMSDACMEKIDYLSLLNYVETKVMYTTVSPFILNASAHIQDYVMSQLYPNMNHSVIVKNKANQVKIVQLFHSGKPLVDVIVRSPSQTLEFRKVHYEDYVPFYDAPSVAKTHARRMLDFISDGDITPTCTVYDKFVDPFHNFTFNTTTKTGCTYLLSGDCSSANTFSVLLTKDDRGKKILRINILKKFIEIKPHEDKDININAQDFNLKDQDMLFIKDDSEFGPGAHATIIKTGSMYMVLLTMHRITVQFDGENVKIITSNVWRNRLCGVCGEYSNRHRNVYEGPDKCSYSEGADFAQTYTLKNDQCSPPAPRGEKFCEDENVDYRTLRFIPYKQCTHMEPFVKNLERKRCVSLINIKSCTHGCQADRSVSKMVNFHCIPSDNQQLFNKVFEEVKSNGDRPVTGKTVHLTAPVSEPIRCISP